MKFRIFRFKKVLSTNKTAIRILKKSDFDSGMVVSENQTAGKGQYGKKWISLKGNLFVSFFYKLNKLNYTLKQLTTMNALLVKKTLSIYYKGKILFKKPNDLLINKKKICGILQELVNQQGKKYIIVGIGINLNKSPIIKKYPTTNLKNLINKTVSKREIESKLRNIFKTKLKKIY